jgi:starvation-inducible outer membrane lipoprotein
MKSIGTVLIAAIALAACDEIPQDARKPFAGPQETKAAAASLESRAAVQDDYAPAGAKK